jgi:hypothetical protein
LKPLRERKTPVRGITPQRSRRFNNRYPNIQGYPNSNSVTYLFKR